MNIVTEVVSTITEWVTAFLTLILLVLNGLVPLFWDGTTGLTVFGILGLMGIAIGLVYLGLNFARGFFLK